jgi:hypothetical protein
MKKVATGIFSLSSSTTPAGIRTILDPFAGGEIASAIFNGYKKIRGAIDKDIKEKTKDRCKIVSNK